MNPRHELTLIPGDGDSLLRSIAGLPALYNANDSLSYYRQTVAVPGAVAPVEQKPEDEKSITEKIGAIPDWNWGRALLGVDWIEDKFKRALVGVAGIVVIGVGLYMVARD